MPISRSLSPKKRSQPHTVKLGALAAVCSLLATAWLPALPSLAARTPSFLGGVVPLSRALRSNGTVRQVHGSFDPAGYRLVLGRRGAPEFVRAGGSSSGQALSKASNAANSGWSDHFGNVGAPDAYIKAVAVAGSKVYIGGDFPNLSADANIPTKNVAMWNGHGWYPMGSGTNGEVDALAVLGSNVYVGGTFTSAGGTPANNIARWNGAHWFALGQGVTNPSDDYSTPQVDALAVSSSTLYVGGTFGEAGGVTAHSIGAWKGGAWHSLGSGILRCTYFDKPNHCYSTPADGTVSALDVVGTTLYVGGQFNYVGSAQRWGLVKWTGSAWNAVAGAGVESNNSAGAVNAIVSNGSDLYVAGNFDHVGGSLASDGSYLGGKVAGSVALLKGPSWKALGTGADNCQGCGNATVTSLAFWNGKLFMSGPFYGANGDASPNIAQWTGSAWKPVSGGLDGPPSRLVAISKVGVVAVGSFVGSRNGAVVLNNIGLWNGKSWTGYGQGLSLGTNAGFVNAVAATGHTVYAAGYFGAAGWNHIDNFARFDGTQWHPLGGGVKGGIGEPYTVAISGKDVFVGGSFTQAGNVAASNIAMWDGKVWHRLQNGVDGAVRDLLVYNRKLYAAGDFSHAGTKATNGVASWDLAKHTWAPVGDNPNFLFGGISTLGAITLSPYNHYLFIGGSFEELEDGASTSTACRAPHCVVVDGLVMFDTNTKAKHPLDGYYYFPGTAKGSAGVTGSVNALYADGLTLYVGGSFADAGGIASHGFAVYNLGNTGSGWKSPGAVGGGSSGGSVQAITKAGSKLYIGGDFTAAGNIAAHNVAAFTPGSTPGTGHWSPLGSGVNSGSIIGASVASVAANVDGLYVGGVFGLAGGKPSENVALWMPGAHP